MVQGKKVDGTPDELAGVIDRFAPKPKTAASDVEGRVISGYESLGRFCVRIFPPKSKVAVTLVWLRSGLTSWRLSGIRLPDLEELPDAEPSTGSAVAAPIPAPNVSAGLQDLRKCAQEQFDDACLKVPDLQERLDSLLAALPKDRREADFDYSLTVSREGFLDGDVVTLSGMQPHAAPYAGAVISVDLRTGTVLVAIHAGGRLSVYGAADKSVASLPSRMQTWIQSREENMKPSTVTVEFL
jgi:hypothetical protein